MMIKQIVLLGAVCLMLFVVILTEKMALPRAFVAWCILVYLIFWNANNISIDATDNNRSSSDWVHLWVFYGFAFWGADLDRDDGTALLVLTTLMHAALIVAGFFVPQAILRDSCARLVVSLLLTIPLACNNLFFHPLLAIVRIVCFLASSALTSNNLSSVYLLFSKAEALLPLIVTHVVVRSLSVNYGRVILELPTTVTPPREKIPAAKNHTSSNNADRHPKQNYFENLIEKREAV